jgi:hypothetical protein
LLGEVFLDNKSVYLQRLAIVGKLWGHIFSFFFYRLGRILEAVIHLEKELKAVQIIL